MKPSRIQAIDHVNLEAPSGSADDLRWFYGQVSGLEEVPGDPQAPPHLCFESAGLELHVWIMGRPRVRPRAFRLTLIVPSLTEAAERLEERTIPYTRLSGSMFTDRRLETYDPAGHPVALKQEWPVITL